jgi:SWI/SNF-related matrix-associated actin-dependent regulator of chromatin subfamily A-like protein 1
MMELFDYQKAAVNAITLRDGVSYLAFEMGLGKSAIAIETAKRRKVRRLLILCPAVGRLVWERELKRWWPQAPVTIVTNWRDMGALRERDGIFVIAYSALSMSKSGGYDYTGSLKKILAARPMDMTVIDEAQALKNPGAIRTKAVLHTLLPGLGWCLPMSGTPAPNHAGELYPILKALFPDAITDIFTGKILQRHEYEALYCNVVDKWFGGRSVRTIDGSKNLNDLRQRMAPFFLRKKKRDVLKDLPDIMFDTYPIVAAAAPAWRNDWSGMREDEFLAALSETDTHVMTMRRLLGEAKVLSAVEAVSDYLDSCNRKVLVFAHHTSVIDGMVDGLADYHPVRIDGRDSPAARQKAIDAFLTDSRCRVFVGQIQAAGTSITLVGPQCDVSDVFFVEADFAPGNNVQAASRIHRIGQKNAVQVWFLTAHGTFDDRIADILARKARDFRVLFDEAG